MTPVKGPSSWKWLLRQVYARMRREFEQKCKACNGTGQHLKPVFCSHKQRYIYSLYDYDYSMKSLNTTRNGLQMIELWPMIIIYNYIYIICVCLKEIFWMLFDSVISICPVVEVMSAGLAHKVPWQHQTWQHRRPKKRPGSLVLLMHVNDC